MSTDTAVDKSHVKKYFRRQDISSARNEVLTWQFVIPPPVNVRGLGDYPNVQRGKIFARVFGKSADSNVRGL